MCHQPRLLVQASPPKRKRVHYSKEVILSPEASWLLFNRRVLLQTERPDFPLLERLRFLAIWASNWDEFFAARITRSFLEARGELEYIKLLSEARAQMHQASTQYRQLLAEAETLGIQLLKPRQLTQAERRYFGAYLAEEVAPRTDLIDDQALGDLSSQALYFAGGDTRLRYLIRLPETLPRLLEIPGRERTYVRLGELVRFRSDLFLPHKTRLYELRIIRLASLERDRVDWGELPEALEDRLEGQVCHLEVEQGFPLRWAKQLQEAMRLQSREIFRVTPPLDLRLTEELIHQGPSSALFPPLIPERPKRFVEDPWSYLDHRELLLQHPYQEYRTIERLLEIAAADPKVKAIRATLYRIGNENPLAEALIQAARAGKNVAVLLEARARFDELTNLYWSLRFQRAGVRVLPLPRKKVHAKAIWIQRGEQIYTHLGTGNYNPTNGAAYSDLSLFSSQPRLGKDLERFFQSLEARRTPQLRLLKTGTAIRKLLVDSILREAHPRGHVILKFNHLTDSALLQALIQATEAGAKVELIIRSTLTQIHPSFKVRSLVGRFLEHSRIAAFKAGGSWDVWAGSADGMPRNFDRRLELFFPIQGESRRKVLKLLKAQLKDDVNTFVLGPNGEQHPLWGGKHNAQRRLWKS